MFENYTYDALMEDAMENAPDGIDTREGSIFFDALSGAALKFAELYGNLDLVYDLSQLATTRGEYLDSKASEHGLTRHAATPAQYYFNYEGTRPEAGSRFFLDGVYFTLYETTAEVLYLECETAGAAYNDYDEGTPVVPVNTINGLASASLGTIYEYGTDVELDEDFRERVQAVISGPAENGNKSHYKAWCESVDGVGIARIIPLWNGPNTVKAVLVNSEGLPCGATIVTAVQNYVDPANNGYTAVVDGVTYVVGDGLGEGAANLGAHFTAAPATSVTVGVTANIELRDGYTLAMVEEDAAEALALYFKNLVLESSSAEDVIVRVSMIGSVLLDLDGVLDYTDLLINGGTSNIEPGEDGVPVVGEVTFGAIL